MIIAVGLLAGIVVLVLAEVLWVVFSGKPVPRPDVPRQEQVIGQGPALRYVVMGDSTTVSQGGEYQKGYAVRSAAYLARHHAVTWLNVGIPGARARDVAGEQLAAAKAFKPDVALVAVGANDVTHLTPIPRVQKSLAGIIDGLRATNPNVYISMTGSPDMGAIPRFPQPLRWYAGKRTAQLNEMVRELAKEKNIVFAPIAEKTGPTFRANPKLFAGDRFHPTTAGYELWTPVIIESLPH